jgi:L-aspartate oxidase
MYTPDTYEKHINDTMIAGDELNDTEILYASPSPNPPIELKTSSTGESRSTKTDQGKFDLGREGGHSERRVLHHKDNTGPKFKMHYFKK